MLTYEYKMCIDINMNNEVHETKRGTKQMKEEIKTYIIGTSLVIISISIIGGLFAAVCTVLGV